MLGKYGLSIHAFNHHGIDHFQVYFICDTDIDCVPPYRKGQRDMIWVAGKVNMNNKEEVESRLGLSVQVYKETPCEQ